MEGWLLRLWGVRTEWCEEPMMTTYPSESAALVAAVRRDMAELAAAEAQWESLDRIAFRGVIGEFIADASRFRTSPPAEVAALVRVVDESPGWVEPETHARFVTARDQALGKPGRLTQDGIVDLAPPKSSDLPDILPRWNVDLVRGSRAHAVDEVRQAQDPEAAGFRLQVLHALDAATTASRTWGTEVSDEFVLQLGERGLATPDAELGIRFEQVNPGRLPGVEQQERAPIALAPQVPVSRRVGH